MAKGDEPQPESPPGPADAGRHSARSLGPSAGQKGPQGAAFALWEEELTGGRAAVSARHGPATADYLVPPG